MLQEMYTNNGVLLSAMHPSDYQLIADRAEDIRVGRGR